MKIDSVSCSYNAPYRNYTNNNTPSFRGPAKEFYGKALKESKKNYKRSRNLFFSTLGATILSIASLITTGEIRSNNYEHPEKTHIINLDTPQKKENCDKAFKFSAIASIVSALLTGWSAAATETRAELLNEDENRYNDCSYYA